MQAQASWNSVRTLCFVAAAALLAGCVVEQGDGPDSIENTAAATVPTLPEGFCDPINFEVLCDQPDILNFNGGATVIIDNPEVSGINTSARVARMQKFPDETFGGTRLNVPNGPIDFSQGEFFRISVFSPRTVALTFKLEEEGNPGGGFERVENHTGSGEWESLCYDLSDQAVPGGVFGITLIFDNGTLGRADSDPDNWTFLYDDIEQLQSCDAGEASGGTAIDPDNSLFSTSGNPSLTIPEDYDEVTAFGSGSVIDTNFVGDETFSPAVSVFSGTGYGANVAQIGLTGFRTGFLGAFQSIDFKVKGVAAGATQSRQKSSPGQQKGLPNQVLFVRLFDGVDSIRINLTSSQYSEALDNDWFQVSIPLSVFDDLLLANGLVLESDNTSPTQFRMLLADLGFSGVGDNPPVVADPGIIPDDVIYTSDPSEAIDLVFGEDYTEVSPFGSGSVFDNNVTTDEDFSPALGVTTGNGYGAQVGQYALLGFQPGFALAYEQLAFKAKGLNNNLIRVKLLDSDPYVDIDLANSDFSTDLGNGWFQVVLPTALLSNNETATGLLFETDNLAPESFTFLLTDFGFSGVGAGVNLLTNGDFEADPADKAPWINAGAVAVNNFYTVQANDGGNVFDTNLSQVTTIDPANMYVLRFRARASVARDIVVGIGLNGGSFAAATVSASLSTNWQSFEFTLDAAGLGEMQDRRVLFDMGTVASTVDIDDVSLTVAGGDGTELLTNGDFQASASDKAPWVNAGEVTTNNFYTVVANDGGNVFDTNLSQVTDIDPANTYVLSFRARANVVRDIIVGIGLNGGSFTAVTATATLGTDWQPFEFTLNAETLGEMQDRRVLFDMGTVASTVDIDDVSLTIAPAG